MGEKNRPRLYLKSKTWIEDERKELLFGKGKTEVLFEIQKTGSLAQAAANLHMSPEKLDHHIEYLRRRLRDTMVILDEDGTAHLSDYATECITKYKQLKQEIEAFANERFKALFLKPRNKRDFKDL
jgi:molybdate transport repressor ModE-like protein